MLAGYSGGAGAGHARFDANREGPEMFSVMSTSNHAAATPAEGGAP